MSCATADRAQPRSPSSIGCALIRACVSSTKRRACSWSKRRRPMPNRCAASWAAGSSAKSSFTRRTIRAPSHALRRRFGRKADQIAATMKADACTPARGSLPGVAAFLGRRSLCDRPDRARGFHHSSCPRRRRLALGAGFAAGDWRPGSVGILQSCRSSTRQTDAAVF